MRCLQPVGDWISGLSYGRLEMVGIASARVCVAVPRVSSARSAPPISTISYLGVRRCRCTGAGTRSVTVVVVAATRVRSAGRIRSRRELEFVYPCRDETSPVWLFSALEISVRSLSIAHGGVVNFLKGPLKPLHRNGREIRVHSASEKIQRNYPIHIHPPRRPLFHSSTLDIGHHARSGLGVRGPRRWVPYWFSSSADPA